MSKSGSKSGKSQKVTPTDLCTTCKGPENTRMVQCDTCDDWYHYSCVGVDEQIQHMDWQCSKCKMGRSKNTKGTLSPVPTVSTHADPSIQATMPLNTSSSQVAVSVTTAAVSEVIPISTPLTQINQFAPLQMHPFMPPHSLVTSQYLLPPHTSMPFVTPMPPVPPFRLTNANVSFSGVTNYNQCQTVPSSSVYQTSSVPITSTLPTFPTTSSTIVPTTTLPKGQPIGPTLPTFPSNNKNLI